MRRKYKGFVISIIEYVNHPQFSRTVFGYSISWEETELFTHMGSVMELKAYTSAIYRINFELNRLIKS